MARKLPRFTLYPLRRVLLGSYILLVVGLFTIGLTGGVKGDDEGRLVCFLIPVFTIVTQFVLLFSTARCEAIRPVRKRRLILPLLVSAAMLAVLGFGATIAAMELYEKPVSWKCALLFVPLVAWVVWGVLFFIYTRPTGRFTAAKRFTSFIFVGSLLELLATIPSHLIVIRRPGCLVGLGTMTGIAAGVYVALWSFGPFLVLLFLRPKKELEESSAAAVPDRPAGIQFSLLGLFLFTLFLASLLAAWMSEESAIPIALTVVLGTVCAWRAALKIRRWEREGPDCSDPAPPIHFRPSRTVVLFGISFAFVSAAYWLCDSTQHGSLLWPATGLVIAWVAWAFAAAWNWERQQRKKLAETTRQK